MSEFTINRHIILPNDVQEVPQLAAFVDEVCEAAGADMSTAMSLNLALEEAVVNVMNYAYPAGTVGDVEIDAQVHDSLMTFTVSDKGTPFDPTCVKEANTTLSAEDRPIGGLGIHLLRTIMDSISYAYVDGQNKLTMTKQLKKE